MTVYVVTDGAYEDYHIEKIFLNKMDADRFVKELIEEEKLDCIANNIAYWECKLGQYIHIEEHKVL